MLHRLLQLTATASLTATAVLVASPVLAHVGHGDEFQQQGDVRQVKANADTDALLGVMTEKPQQGAQGLTVPSAAVVDADGKSLVFVKSGTTYDPVFVEAGAASGDRVFITSGIDPTDEVVVQGALSLYAESKKSEQSESAPPATAPVNSKVPAPSESPLNPWGVGAAAVGVVVLGGFAATRLGRRSK